MHLIHTILFLAASLSAGDWVAIKKGNGSIPHGTRVFAAAQVKSEIRTLGVMRLSEKPDTTNPNYIFEPIHPVHHFAVRTVPNDSRYQYQWHWDVTRSPEAWSIQKSSGVLIGHLDTGIFSTHLDLAGRVVQGKNFINPSLSSYQDDNYHGTFTSALIGANSNDGFGVAGQIWGASFLCSKVLDNTGYGDDYGVAEGMVWAVDQGAKILSMSLGSDINGTLFQTAVSYALSRGVLIVASSGNSGGNDTYFPSYLPGVLCVGATDKFDNRSSFSTFNSNLQIMAPGGDGWGGAGDIHSAVPGGFSSGAGTSYSCPQVAGAAALYWAIHPSARAAEVFAALTGTADPIDKVTGWSATTGWGRLNVERLLGQSSPPNVFMAGVLPALIDGAGNSLSVSCGAGKPAPGPLNLDTSAIVATVTAYLYDDLGNTLTSSSLTLTGPRTFSGQIWVPTWVGPGLRTLQVGYIATDSSGLSSDLKGLTTLTQAPAGSSITPGPTPSGPTYTPTPIPGPYLSHPTPQNYLPGYPIPFSLVAYSPITTLSPILFWRLAGSSGAFSALPMAQTAPNLFSASLTASQAQNMAVQYYFSATDSLSQTSFLPFSGTFSVSPYPLGGQVSLNTPALYHNAPNGLRAGEGVSLEARVSSITPLFGVTLTYWHPQLDAWFTQTMQRAGGNTYSTSVNGRSIPEGTFRYYLTAIDRNGVEGYFGSQGQPVSVPVMSKIITARPIPNPSQDKICVQILPSKSGKAALFIHNLAGELVFSQELDLTAMTALTVCTERQLATGIYIGQVRMESGQASFKAALVR